jgi:hypothetical protein
MLKTCRDCKRELPIEEFYKHPMMGDGHLNKCADCVRLRVKKHRERNLEKIRAYDRARGYRPSAAEKIVARNAVNHALARGEIEVKPCERCGFGIGVQAHHEDYNKPLEVVWLCRPCHGQRHREINQERRKAG